MATETASSAADKSLRRAVQLQGTPPGRVGPESRLQGKCLSVRFHLRFLQSNSQPYENCAGKIPKNPIHQDYSIGMGLSITWECFILFYFCALLPGDRYRYVRPGLVEGQVSGPDWLLPLQVLCSIGGWREAAAGDPQFTSVR